MSQYNIFEVIILKTLGEHIRELRLNKKMKQEDLAEAAGITKASISGYELNKRNPPYRVIHDIAKALSVPESDLLQYITLDESDDSFKYAIGHDRVPETINGVEYATVLSDPIGDETPMLQMAFAASLNNLSNEGRRVALQRVKELCFVPMYKRTVANLLREFIYSRWKLSYTLLEESDFQKLCADESNPSVNMESFWHLRHIILQRKGSANITKIWDFVYYSFNTDIDEPDISPILCSEMSQYQPGCSVGFIFDNHFAFQCFYNTYQEHKRVSQPYGEFGKSNKTLFLCIEKSSLNIIDIKEYDPNI